MYNAWPDAANLLFSEDSDASFAFAYSAAASAAVVAAAVAAISAATGFCLYVGVSKFSWYLHEAEYNCLNKYVVALRGGKRRRHQTTRAKSTMPYPFSSITRVAVSILGGKVIGRCAGLSRPNAAR